MKPALRKSCVILRCIVISSMSCLCTVDAIQPTLERIEYLGVPAFRLTDGKTEAVIVPEFSGRIMRYGAVGGQNLLWNSGPKSTNSKWTNLGGDKCFIGPHKDWHLFSNSLWPPKFATWDGDPHVALELPGAKLRTTGPAWDGFEAKITREFSFDPDGGLLIEQSLEKTGDSPTFLALWTVSQAMPPDAVYIPLHPESPYQQGFYPWSKLPPEVVCEQLAPRLLRILPTLGKGYKLGADSPVAAIATLKDRTIWLQRAELQKGNYPDGADGAGFPVEFYNHDASGAGQYVELELLSSQRVLKRGEILSLNIRWSLHPLVAADFLSKEASVEIEALFKP